MRSPAKFFNVYTFSYDRDAEEKLSRVRRRKQKWGTTFFGKLYVNVTISRLLQETLTRNLLSRLWFSGLNNM